MKIFVDENIPHGKALFAPYGQVTLFPGRQLTRDMLQGVQALIVRSITKVSETLLKDTPVKFVGTATIGTDHVDMDYLNRQSISFAYAPGCNSNSVGEYWTAAVLQLKHRFNYRLAGRTLGIIGYGNVGRNVEQKALAIGMRVVKNDPPLEELEPGRHELVSLRQLQKQSDIITLHVPLTRMGKHPTIQMVNEDFFKNIAKPVVLINTCRGDVIHEDCVIEAKKKGAITHLVMDVFPKEPGINPELVSQCEIATPHIAGYSQQGKLNGGIQILRAFCQCFKLDYPEVVPDPHPPDPVLPYQEGTDEEVLLECVTRAYPILEDDKRLRASLRSPDPDSEFDSLRKNYPQRFEFPYYKVNLPPGNSSLLQLFQNLGFQVA